MPLHPKAITVFLDPSRSGDRRAARAAAFAKRWRLPPRVGVHVVYKGTALHPSMAYARSEKAIAGVVAHERRMDEACECARDEVGERFLAHCAEQGVSAEFRPINRANTTDAAITRSLHSDLQRRQWPKRLIASDTRNPSGLPGDMSAEKVLLASGVPLLIIPNEWRGESIGERVMIGWNASPEVRRAVTDAMCFLLDAGSVKALVVDPAGCKWLGGETGCHIGGHLSRHGAEVDLVEVASRSRPIAEVILAEAKASGTDLLVCGARSPAHLQEILFGNATRKLLSKMPVPVLISR